ncbi:MAG: SO_0444 family Cu/Zn efflux transporter [Muribaculaceae bacterium]
MTLFETFIMLLNEMSPYLLLGFLAAGILHSFVPQSLYAKHLAGSDWRSVVKAAMFGIPLPLCSCGVLPTAVSLRNTGASRASSTSFLIATPQTGVDSIAATYSLLGLAFAVIRPVAALVTALLGGVLVARVERTDDATRSENLDCCCEDDDCCCHSAQKATTFIGKVAEALRYGFIDMIKSIGRWLVIGLVVATLITVCIPDDFFAAFAQYPVLNMIVVLALSIPMYVCATGSIPIALSLMLKGLTPGAALVLLMAGPAANFASVLVINRAFGKRATVGYLASIIGGAMAFGLLADYVLPASWFVPQLADGMVKCSHCASWLNVVCSIVLVALLVVTQVGMILRRNKIINNNTIMTKEYKIKGMMCAHCQANVEKNLGAIAGVKSVKVDLKSGVAYVEGDVTPEVIIAKIEQLGYEYIG